jgi:hypothetical protein
MENVKMVILLLFVGVFLLIGPILVIWSMNTLFPVLMIPYTLETWIATFILSGAFGSLVKSSISSVEK